ncbi:MAG: hypothetical protein IJ354_04730 [Clostridia bacterium]|nr:hypothetical protein [Clostridia bacterium]
MTPDLKKEQAEVFKLLQKAGGNCFLRMDQSDDALWVTDFPRRNTQHHAVLKLLELHGISCCAGEKNNLWHLDWSAQRWEEIAVELPQQIPTIPIREQYHVAYALCRLWMLHSENEQDLRPARRLLKLMTEQEEKLLRAITAIHENAAALLRNGEQGAYMAGRILAAWLIEKEMQI